MYDKLVIVESPSKSKTIENYLGKDYHVTSSKGHIRDLSTSGKDGLGIDQENEYKPKYVISKDKKDVVKELKAAVKEAKTVYLATDPDREGEAISWHLADVLGLDMDADNRVVFNEVTKDAVVDALNHPRKIDQNLVKSQETRRVLDRIIGFKLSKLLQRKIKSKSAGRVQSVALRLIVEKEREIEAFVPEEYWKVKANFIKDDIDFVAELNKKGTKKVKISNEAEALEIFNALSKSFVVDSVKKTSKKRESKPPFITSTLQQEASSKLGFKARKTMMIAQKLYEGVQLEDETVGLITYMRTDSVRISEEAQGRAIEFIKESYGEEYIPEKLRVYKGKKNIQDAHEAIRPSHIEITPEIAKANLTPEQYKLYSLIWKRFIASQMASCALNTNSIDIANGKYTFKASGSTIKFDGFMKVYDYTTEDDENDVLLPSLEEGEVLEPSSVEGKQHFTQPPARYTEASFVKLLEEKGIGRPSTYVPTISTLLSREYVIREKKNLIPTELGFIVNNIMSDYFKQIVDVDFTAGMERKLDNIEEGNEEWKKVVGEFFEPLQVAIEKAEKEISKVVIEDKVSDVPCDKCGRMMVIKKGRYGTFLACPGYPECKNAKPIVEELDVPCPKCGGKILAKRSKKGKKFFGCSNYPNCDFVSWNEPIKEPCPKCGSYMTMKFSKTKGNYAVCSNGECGNTMPLENDKLENDKKEE